MRYQENLESLTRAISKKEKHSVRNVILLFNEEQYHMLISILDFGKRVEIKKENSDAHLIYIEGVVGLNEEHIFHMNNEGNILRMLNRFNSEIINEIVSSPNILRVTHSTLLRKVIPIPKKITRIKTSYDISTQIDRILDRYNDYLFLSTHPLFSDEIYTKKAQKVMRLLGKSVGRNIPEEPRGVSK